MAQLKGPWIARLLIGGVLGFILLAAAVLYWAHHTYTKPGPLLQDQAVIIEPGGGLVRISYVLRQDGAIENETWFKLAVRLSGSTRQLQAGEFLIPAHASIEEVIAILKSGDVIEHRLTIPEGLSSLQIVATLNAHDRLKGEVTELPAEASILPETYHYTYGTTRAELIARMQAQMQAVTAELWPGRDNNLPFETLEEALVLASIIEKETAVPSERQHVAGVFVNRLKRNMRLQSDPTVIYGMTGGAELDRLLTTADLEATTPYNTYRINGLPPTPIAHPGRESIYAALHPMETKDLYFVADGTGGHAFAETYEEHLRNVRRWREINR